MWLRWERSARVLDKAAEAGAALRTAAELAEDAQGLLKSAADGSLQADVDTANAQFAEAIRGVAELHRRLGAGVDGTQKILHSLELDGSTPASAEVAKPAVLPLTPGRPPRQGIREDID